MARPGDGLKHVDRLDGPHELKQRLRVVLEVLQGSTTIEEACRILKIKEARFHELRKQALEGALHGLAPRPPGRPRRSRPVAPTSLKRLEREKTRLLQELRAAEVREELALTVPHVLQTRLGKKRRR